MIIAIVQLETCAASPRTRHSKIDLERLLLTRSLQQNPVQRGLHMHKLQKLQNLKPSHPKLSSGFRGLGLNVLLCSILPALVTATQESVLQTPFNLQLRPSLFRNEFSQLLRKMGYHLPMIFQNVSVSCAESRASTLHNIGPLMNSYSISISRVIVIFPEGPSTQIVGSQGPRTIQRMALGT